VFCALTNERPAFMQLLVPSMVELRKFCHQPRNQSRTDAPPVLGLGLGLGLGSGGFCFDFLKINIF
jgi:hypothetical protein